MPSSDDPYANGFEVFHGTGVVVCGACGVMVVLRHWRAHRTYCGAELARRIEPIGYDRTRPLPPSIPLDDA